MLASPPTVATECLNGTASATGSPCWRKQGWTAGRVYVDMMDTAANGEHPSAAIAALIKSDGEERRGGAWRT